MISERKEKTILRLSFVAGLAFALVELIFAIYSHSQSALTDAVYDASELVFIALLLFLTPLFHKPVSEKHPYGYFQLESIFLIVKGVMMLSVTLGVVVEVIESALSGGNPVNDLQVSLFQLCLGAASVVIYIIMRRVNKNSSSPTVEAELMGWRLDIGYSLGMSLAFFASSFLVKTPLAFIAPYFDQIIAVLVMVFMLPESVKMLWSSVRDIFLFSPDEELVEQIKQICTESMENYAFSPVFFDITRTGRHLWVAVYFKVSSATLAVEQLKKATEEVNQKISSQLEECTCELILAP
ncbi:MAG: cation diffusion facilitator family transporter [Negativibacillus sp.]|nr:cation diffusion facilitator family transporter [Negativibacillus sp.]